MVGLARGLLGAVRARGNGRHCPVLRAGGQAEAGGGPDGSGRLASAVLLVAADDLAFVAVSWGAGAGLRAPAPPRPVSIDGWNNRKKGLP